MIRATKHQNRFPPENNPEVTGPPDHYCAPDALAYRPQGMSLASDPLAPPDTFARRHLGPNESEMAAMLAQLGHPSLDALIDAAVPASLRLRRPLRLPSAAGESAALAELRTIARRNKVFRSFIGVGYYDTLTPPVIQRTIFENPGWYTAYTPYQAEISQGRLEALLNYQTMICDLTGLGIANASMLDEGTAAAEAMMLCHRMKEGAGGVFFVSDACHPQTIDVVRTRARPLRQRARVATRAADSSRMSSLRS